MAHFKYDDDGNQVLTDQQAQILAVINEASALGVPLCYDDIGPKIETASKARYRRAKADVVARQMPAVLEYARLEGRPITAERAGGNGRAYFYRALSSDDAVRGLSQHEQPKIRASVTWLERNADQIASLTKHVDPTDPTYRQWVELETALSFAVHALSRNNTPSVLQEAV